jgi:hypothetical protein
MPQNFERIRPLLPDLARRSLRRAKVAPGQNDKNNWGGKK